MGTIKIIEFGLRSADLPRESARYRDLLACQPNEAAWHGFSLVRQTVDAGRCQRRSRLAYLGGFGSAAHPTCPQTLLQRQLWNRAFQYGVCPGCHDHRLVSVAVSMGAFSYRQGSSQTSYAARSARQHSSLHSYLGRQDPRGQRAGYAGLRGLGRLFIRVTSLRGNRIKKGDITLRKLLIYLCPQECLFLFRCYKLQPLK